MKAIPFEAENVYVHVGENIVQMLIFKLQEDQKKKEKINSCCCFLFFAIFETLNKNA